MKKLAIVALVLCMSSFAFAQISLEVEVLVNGVLWDGQSSVVGGDIVTVNLLDTGSMIQPFSAYFSVTVDHGDYVEDSLNVEPPFIGALTITSPVDDGFIIGGPAVYFGTLVPADDIVLGFSFYVPTDLQDASMINITWTGLYDGVEVADFDFFVVCLCKSPLEVSIDIRPASCFNPLNVQNDDVLPVAVLGMEDFDVNDIDIASVRLADVAPFRSNYLDITGPESNEPNACGCTATCPDGYTDLALKFRTTELVEVLTDIYGDISEGDELELTLTGQLYDGTLIEGLDYITVVGQVPHRLNNPDLNNDQVIDFLDFALLAEHWLKGVE